MPSSRASRICAATPAVVIVKLTFGTSAGSTTGFGATSTSPATGGATTGGACTITCGGAGWGWGSIANTSAPTAITAESTLSHSQLRGWTCGGGTAAKRAVTGPHGVRISSSTTVTGLAPVPTA